MAFTHAPAGYPDGYPLLFDTRLTEKRAAQVLAYAQDGGYLSALLTRSLSVELLVYNPGAVVFGFARMELQWEHSGDIKGRLYVAVSGAGN